MSAQENTARAPPGREVHSRSCLAQMRSASAWVRRRTDMAALWADMRLPWRTGRSTLEHGR